MQVNTSDSLSPKSTALRLREFVNDTIDSTILCSLRMYERDRVLFDGQANHSMQSNRDPLHGPGGGS